MMQMQCVPPTQGTLSSPALPVDRMISWVKNENLPIFLRSVGRNDYATFRTLTALIPQVDDVIRIKIPRWTRRFSFGG